MASFKGFLTASAAFVLACQIANCATKLKPAPLPVAEGTIVGAAFSPDNDLIAIVRYIHNDAPSGRHTIQVVDLKSGKQLSQAEVPNEEPPYLAMSPHFINYSYDGRYLLLGATGMDVLVILDAANLEVAKRIVLHPETQHRRLLSPEGSRNFKGVVSLAVASQAGVFGALTHDERGVNEIFVGSFSSGRIIRSWTLGEGRTQTEVGGTSLSISEDGSRTAASVVPPTKDKLPKDFKNVRVYKSESGELISAIRTDAPVGPITLFADESVLVSRIDTPSIFSKKLCIEKWNLDTSVVTDRFCDSGRHVILLSLSHASDQVAGFACQIHRDIEGNVYSVPGRIDVWAGGQEL
jgi:hypothetical protein